MQTSNEHVRRAAFWYHFYAHQHGGMDPGNGMEWRAKEGCGWCCFTSHHIANNVANGLCLLSMGVLMSTCNIMPTGTLAERCDRADKRDISLYTHTFTHTRNTSLTSCLAYALIWLHPFQVHSMHAAGPAQAQALTTISRAQTLAGETFIFIS